MVNVPLKFQPRQTREYPPGNVVPFEEWFFSNYGEVEAEREYLPVLWTSYYCQNGYGKEPTSIKELQKFIDGLPKKKYFTIVQYDDGILNDLSGLDIKVFAMSGDRIDYPLPLICWHTERRPAAKNFLCNFIGRNTHWVRALVLQNDRLRRPGWFVSDRKYRKHEYMGIMSMSTFTLCPRGYGKTSFRIQEALECGSIPVYISDKFIIPHGVNFDTYGVTLTPDRINDLPEILEGISEKEIKTKQKLLPEILSKYYSYEGNRELIMTNI